MALRHSSDLPDQATDPPPTIGSLVPSVYVPSLLFAIGQGAVIPIIAVTARGLGASVAMAAFVVALRGIGTMLADVPGGRLIAHIGERGAMVVGTTILTLALLGCVVATEPWMMAVSMLAVGAGWSVWLLARLTYVSEVMPVQQRGRALSLLGGVQRIGNFAGPFLGALVVVNDNADGVFIVHIVLAAAGCVVLVAITDPHTSSAAATGGHPALGVRRIAGDHRATFRTVGVVAGSLSVLRSSRLVLLPLWADSIGLDARQISVIFGVSAALDMVLFVPAGFVSDRWGRKAVALPCLGSMTVGMLLIPLTQSFVAMLLVGLIIGFGNGLGSGLVMTLGADSAPAIGRAEFLGVWRLVGDVGTAGGPLLISGVQAVTSLTVGAGTIGLVGAFGMVLMANTPEPSDLFRERSLLGPRADETT